MQYLIETCITCMGIRLRLLRKFVMFTTKKYREGQQLMLHLVSQAFCCVYGNTGFFTIFLVDLQGSALFVPSLSGTTRNCQ